MKREASPCSRAGSRRLSTGETETRRVTLLAVGRPGDGRKAWAWLTVVNRHVGWTCAYKVHPFTTGQ